MRSLKLIAAPGTQPVVLADIEAQVRTSLTAESALIAAYIGAIIAKVEGVTGRALITQTWDLGLDGFPCGGITLPLPPLQAVDSITYRDSSGATQTLAADQYEVDSASEPARIVPAYGVTWPATLGRPNDVVVRFTCGYGDAATDVPEAIKVWIMMNVADLYENRESVVIGNGGVMELKTIVDGLIDSFRVVSFQ